MTTATAPNVTVEDAGPCRKRLKIEIAGDQVAERIESSFADLQANAALPGFRPGKAPRKLVEKRFGRAVRDEVKQRLVGEAYESAVKEHDLRVLGEPEGGDELAEARVEPGEPIAFSVEVEVVPEFELPDLSDVTIQKPTMDVTDEMIDEQIKKACINEGELEDKGKAGPGDYVVGHGTLKNLDSGEDVHDIEGAVIQIPDKGSDGAGMILGVLVEDFAEQVGSPKAGDTVTVKTKGPENHEVEAVRGKDLEATFEVKEVHAIKPLEVGELVKKLGVESEEKLREAVRRQLESRVEADQKAEMRRQVATALLDKIDFELPAKLTERQAARNLHRRRYDLMQRGVDENEIERHVAEMRSASDETARRELKLYFVLNKVATERNVQISEQEVGGAIAQMAMNRGVHPAELRDHLVQTGQVQGVAQQVRENKTLEALLDQAKVEEVDAEKYREQQKKDAEKA